MKKILLLALIAFAMNAKAQITLEHTYDTASTMNVYVNDINQLMIINFEETGEHYVKINRLSRTISIYNLDHSLLRTIDCLSLPSNNNGTMGDILYLSENLFDTDSLMEFMYIYTFGAPYNKGATKIVKENGVIIFSDTGAAAVHTNWPMQQWPVYNTSQGTKMILSYSNRQAKVFSLPGTLSDAIAEANNVLVSQSNVSNAYPNPTNNTTQIDYTLPIGINEGEIVFYDLLGNEVKSFKVDRTFNTLLISTSDIASGTYYYQLQTTMENSEGKKMVVIK